MKRLLCITLTLCLLVGAAAADTLYYNPDGGSRYHADANCRSVSDKYLPMSPFDDSRLTEAPFDTLLACPFCTGAEREETPAYIPQATDAAASSEIVTIDTEDVARAYAEAFFASPYVGESLADRTIAAARTKNGWQAVASGKDKARLTLLFDSYGRIAQYTNSDYALPSLENLVIQEDTPLKAIQKLDEIRMVLFPYVENNQGGPFAYDAARNVTCYALDDCSTWILTQGEDKIVGFGDWDENARYSGCITRDEAVSAANDALTDTERNAMQLVSAKFVANGADGLPQWLVTFDEGKDADSHQREYVIDAATGAVLDSQTLIANG